MANIWDRQMNFGLLYPYLQIQIEFVYYLGVKRVALQLILALELPGVRLVHRQTVLGSLEDLGFIHLPDA